MNEGNGRSQVLWYFPFEKLKRSADDGQRMLWLEFGADESEQVKIKLCDSEMLSLIKFCSCNAVVLLKKSRFCHLTFFFSQSLIYIINACTQHKLTTLCFINLVYVIIDKLC